MITYDIYDDYDESEIQKRYREIAFRELFSVLGNNFSQLSELNVLEVAAAKGELTQKLTKVCRHVTAIDPKLTIEEDKCNLTKVEGYFNRDTNCSRFNLLLCCLSSGGDENCPHGLDEDIVYVCKKYNIPFFIILCNCKHGFETKEQRYNHLVSQASESAKLYKDEYEIWYLTSLKRLKNMC